MAATTPFEAQKRLEARRRYDQLTDLINALDTDIGRELDSERKHTLQEKRTDLVRERDTAAAELSALGWGVSDGNNDEIRAKIAELLAALDGKQPERAHKILGDIVTIDARMQAAEGAIKDHNGRIIAIERRIDPPWIVTFWRVCAVLSIICGLTAAALWRVVLFQLYLPIGIMIEGAFLGLALVCFFQANAQLERVK